MNDLTALEERIAKRLDSFRFAHTLSVRDECLQLAELFELSERDTTLLAEAALLHDSTKALQIAEQATLAQILGIELTQDDLDSPATLHAITGAAMARVDFDAPVAVTAAIACHTTGKENMTLFDKLLFLADYIEPTRKFEDCIRVRRYFYEESVDQPLEKRLNATLLLAFDLTIAGLIEEGRPIHPQTIKSRNFLLKNS
ncbi:MAG: bis(5'-nucleosyl)-tetraphosphatase (symmetrical) YqeK [Clostridia bacterium]|nr:bis(5'-nucleosyl)-tetraphosphatase (symmetrical) YqeK [Clostridia bacterium]